MGWESPDSLWVRKMRRRLRLCRVFTWAAALAAPLILLRGLFALRDVQRSGELSDPSMIIACAIMIAVFVFLIVGLLVGPCQKAKELKRILTLVPETDGQLCIKCVERLTEASVCQLCGQQFDQETIRAYWELFAFAPSTRVNQRGELLDGDIDDESQVASQVGATCRRILLDTALPVACLIVLVAVIAALSGGSILLAMVDQLPWLAYGLCLGAGIVMIAKGRVGERAGKARHCPECGYQRIPTGSNPDRCPECGLPWSGSGGSVTGRPVLQRRRLFLGLLLCLVAFGALMSASGRSGTGWVRRWGVRLLPTSSLINQATTDELFRSGAVWDELTNRSLSKEQRHALAAALMDGRRDREQGMLMMCKPAGAWFATELASGSLPDNLIQRYYDEMMDVSLTVPDHPVKVGERFSVLLPVDERTNINSFDKRGNAGEVYFRGLTIEPAANSTASVRDARTNRPTGVLDPGKGPLTTTMTAHTPGSLVVRAVLWEVVGPWDVVRSPVVWNDDDTPVIPTGVTWSKRVVLEALVEIVEP